MSHCPDVLNHDPETTCQTCGYEVDKYGNTENDFRNCCFPDCGCDGARLCMVGKPNTAAAVMNIERGSNPWRSQ